MTDKAAHATTGLHVHFYMGCKKLLTGLLGAARTVYGARVKHKGNKLVSKGKVEAQNWVDAIMNEDKLKQECKLVELGLPSKQW